MKLDILHDICKKCGGMIHRFNEAGRWSHDMFQDLLRCGSLAVPKTGEEKPHGERSTYCTE